MAARTGTFYVYAIMDGDVCVYVGKGSGRRSQASARKHCGKAVVLEQFKSEADAFTAERKWIAELMPCNNVCPGGNGGRVKPASPYDLPKSLVGVLSKSEWKRHVKDGERQTQEIERIGTRKYAAKMLLEMFTPRQLAAFDISKVALDRLYEVANG